RPKTKEYVTLMARVPEELAERAQRYARLHQQSISVVLRDGLELLLEDDRFRPWVSDTHAAAPIVSDTNTVPAFVSDTNEAAHIMSDTNTVPSFVSDTNTSDPIVSDTKQDRASPAGVAPARVSDRKAERPQIMSDRKKDMPVILSDMKAAFQILPDTNPAPG